MYKGDRAEDSSLTFEFTTSDADGARVSISASLEVADFRVFKDGVLMTGLDVSPAVISITEEPVDTELSPNTAMTGAYMVSVNMANSASFTTGSDYAVLFHPSDETVATQAVSKWVGSWSCENTLLGQPAGASIAADLATIEAQTDDIGTAGAGLTALPWNSAWDAEVQSEVDDGLRAIHLHHLLETDYDPASKPGVATALLNELIENDGGVSRYTANALEQAPTDVNVTSMAADVITASALNTDAVTEIWAKVVESQGSITAQQAMSVIVSVLAGETSSSGNTFSTPDGVSTRVAATTNASNERTAITLTPSS